MVIDTKVIKAVCCDTCGNELHYRISTFFGKLTLFVLPCSACYTPAKKPPCSECGKEFSHYTGCSFAVELPRE